jgi:hypothetical protein
MQLLSLTQVVALGFEALPVVCPAGFWLLKDYLGLLKSSLFSYLSLFIFPISLFLIGYSI